MDLIHVYFKHTDGVCTMKYHLYGCKHEPGELIGWMYHKAYIPFMHFQMFVVEISPLSDSD